MPSVLDLLNLEYIEENIFRCCTVFDGFTLIDPGLAWITQWRPDRPQDVPEHPENLWFLAGMGRLSERS